LNKEYWWLVTDSIEDAGKSGLISFAVANKYSNYAKLKRVVWKWFRSHLDSKDISSREKIILWCLCERFGNSFSSHDAISYYGQMCGLSSVTMGKGFAVLMDKNIIWCAKQDQRVMLRKLKSGMQHKHFLLVGLGVMLESESQKD
jgi:hypothetical protein